MEKIAFFDCSDAVTLKICVSVTVVCLEYGLLLGQCAVSSAMFDHQGFIYILIYPYIL